MKLKLKRGWMWTLERGRYCTAVKECWARPVIGSKVTMEGRCCRHLSDVVVIPSHEHYAKMLSDQLRELETELTGGRRDKALSRLRSLRRILAP